GGASAVAAPAQPPTPQRQAPPSACDRPFHCGFLLRPCPPDCGGGWPDPRLHPGRRCTPAGISGGHWVHGDTVSERSSSAIDRGCYGADRAGAGGSATVRLTSPPASLTAVFPPRHHNGEGVGGEVRC